MGQEVANHMRRVLTLLTVTFALLQFGFNLSTFAQNA